MIDDGQAGACLRGHSRPGIGRCNQGLPPAPGSSGRRAIHSAMSSSYTFADSGIVKVGVGVGDALRPRGGAGAGVDAVPLGNMSLDDLRRAVAMISGCRAVSRRQGRSASRTAAVIAETSVDLISVGWLTHSAPILDHRARLRGLTSGCGRRQRSALLADRLEGLLHRRRRNAEQSRIGLAQVEDKKHCARHRDRLPGLTPPWLSGSCRKRPRRNRKERNIDYAITLDDQRPS